MFSFQCHTLMMFELSRKQYLYTASYEKQYFTNVASKHLQIAYCKSFWSGFLREVLILYHYLSTVCFYFVMKGFEKFLLWKMLLTSVLLGRELEDDRVKVRHTSRDEHFRSHLFTDSFIQTFFFTNTKLLSIETCLMFSRIFN